MRKIDMRAAVIAGLIGGAVFLVLEMILVAAAYGASAWTPPRMIAAILLGSGVLPPPDTFHLGIFVAALVVHFVLAIVYVGIFGLLAPSSRLAAALLGGMLGLVLYLINFYGFASLWFPWFAEARNWVSIVSHIIYGMVAAYVYVRLVHSHHREDVLLNGRLEKVFSR